MSHASPPRAVPSYTVPQRPAGWHPADFRTWPWHELPQLTELQRADGSGAPTWPTQVHICADATALYTRFHCHDPHIWANQTERDAPIYTEEVVEVFIAPGADTPTLYYEFELSPNGVLLDLRVVSPNGNRKGIALSAEWDCAQVEWHADRNDAEDWWRGFLVLPWQSVCELPELPPVWRANFYRIERPAQAKPEFTAWSPTYTTPADYHRPAHFGILHFPRGDSPAQEHAQHP